MKKINKNIEDAFMSYFLEATDDDINHILNEEVKDMSNFLRTKEQHLRKINFLARATANKQRDEYLLSQVAEKLHNAILVGADKPVAYLKQMMSSPSTPAYFSGLEKLSKEDIVEIIKDKNLIEILEKLDSNESY